MRRISVFLVIFCLLAAAPALAQKAALVKATSLSLRSEPSAQAERITTLITYQPVEVLETRGKSWARVQTRDGQSGWVMAQYLTETGFVSVNHPKLNVRRGPSTDYAIIMNYGKHFPLWVLDVARNGWLKVRDLDGDRGWVHPNLVKIEPHYVITRLAKCNIRTGVGTDNPIKFTAERGVVLEVLDEKDGWLKIRHADGDEGWMSAKIVYGWLDVEPDEDD